MEREMSETAFDKIKAGMDDAAKLVKGKSWAVEVLTWDSETPVRIIQADSYREAEKISLGMNINLDHSRYRTVIAPPSKNVE
jgi:hypothetical protein